jgi:putative flippase GtrA
MSPIRSPQAQLLAREMLGYGMASAVAFGTDISMLTLLVKVAGWHYLPASVVSFVAGGFVAYGLSVRFVFHRHRIQSRPLELGSFIALGLAGLGVNSIVLSIGVGNMGASLLSAKLCAAACTFGTNFTLRRQFLFVEARTGDEPWRP